MKTISRIGAVISAIWLALYAILHDTLLINGVDVDSFFQPPTLLVPTTIFISFSWLYVRACRAIDKERAMSQKHEMLLRKALWTQTVIINSITKDPEFAQIVYGQNGTELESLRAKFDQYIAEGSDPQRIPMIFQEFILAVPTSPKLP